MTIALVNETLPTLASSTTVHGTPQVLILCILGISITFYLFICCLQCMMLIEDDLWPRYSRFPNDDERQSTEGSNVEFMHNARRSRSHQATVGSNSLQFEARLQSESIMPKIFLSALLLTIVVAFILGAVKITVWMVHLSGGLQGALVNIWDAVGDMVIQAWDSVEMWVIHAWRFVEVPMLIILGVSLVLVILLYAGLPVMGFVSYGIAPLSYAALWMSEIGIVAAGSLFAILQSLAMGGIPLLMVVLCIVVVVTVVVGAFEIIVWVVRSCAIPATAWLVHSWESSTAWVVHAWGSFEKPVTWLHNLWSSVAASVCHAWDSFHIFGWWNSFVASLHHLWASLAHHHKWKIYA